MEILTKHSTANNSLLKVVFASLFIFLPFLGFFLGMQYQTLVTEIPESPTSLIRKLTPTPHLSNQPYPTLNNNQNETANWKIYISQDKSFSFKYPNDWTDQPIQTFGSRSVTEFRYKNTPLFTVSLIGNYSQVTGQSYQNLEEYLGLVGLKSVKPKAILLDGKDARRVTDQGQAGHVVPFEETVAFSQDKKTIIDLYFEADYYPQAKENGTFDQILSTFQFTDNSTVPTPTPTKNITTLKYNLPSGWITVNDKDNQFSVGYDPNAWEVSPELLPGYISFLEKTRHSLYTSIGLFPYDGGSRHTFIFKQMGQPQTKGDEPEAYREVEYTYNGRSCLFLEHLYISMSPSVWGMCDVGGNRALLFNSYELDYQTILQTFKLLK